MVTDTELCPSSAEDLHNQHIIKRGPQSRRVRGPQRPAEECHCPKGLCRGNTIYFKNNGLFPLPRARSAKFLDPTVILQGLDSSHKDGTKNYTI